MLSRGLAVVKKNPSYVVTLRRRRGGGSGFLKKLAIPRRFFVRISAAFASLYVEGILGAVRMSDSYFVPPLRNVVVLLSLSITRVLIRFWIWKMKLMLLIEDLERLQLKLQMEAVLQQANESLSKRLADMAIETSDALAKAKSIEPDPAVPDSLH